MGLANKFVARYAEAMNTNDVLKTYAEKQVKLTIRLLDEDDVLIEGSSEALEFLGNLLLAHVADKEDGRHIGPNAAGNVFFTPESTKGIYIHRLPCSSHNRSSK